MPKRIKMSRQHPWRAENPDAVIVARPTKWGNPFATRIPHGETLQGSATRALLAAQYRAWVTNQSVSTQQIINAMPLVDEQGRIWVASSSAQHRPTLREIRTELAGRDLACWCPLDQPCHADVLLELANPEAADV